MSEIDSTTSGDGASSRSDEDLSKIGVPEISITQLNEKSANRRLFRKNCKVEAELAEFNYGLDLGKLKQSVE